MTIKNRSVRYGMTMLLLLSSFSCIILRSFVHGFTMSPMIVSSRRSRPSPVAFTKSVTQLFEAKGDHSSTTNLPDISTMKASQMKQELESYGISTRSMFEKSEFEAALRQARAEGKTPIPNSSKGTSSKRSSSKSASNKNNATREQRFAQAFEDAQKMKVSELKKELSSRGVSTKSFFEKSEFIKAYADAVADNVGADRTSSRIYEDDDEPYDPSYRDVVMQKFDSRALGGKAIIDVKV